METNAIIAISALSVVVILLIIFSFKTARKNKAYIKRFSKIIDVEDKLKKKLSRKTES
jgi:uncharacterized membrane protein YqiK